MTTLLHLTGYYVETHYGESPSGGERPRPVVRVVRKHDGRVLRFDVTTWAYDFLWRFANDGPGEQTKKWAQDWIDWFEEEAKGSDTFWEEPETRRYRTRRLGDEAVPYPWHAKAAEVESKATRQKAAN